MLPQVPLVDASSTWDQHESVALSASRIQEVVPATPIVRPYRGDLLFARFGGLPAIKGPKASDVSYLAEIPTNERQRSPRASVAGNPGVADGSMVDGSLGFEQDHLTAHRKPTSRADAVRIAAKLEDVLTGIAQQPARRGILVLSFFYGRKGGGERGAGAPKRPMMATSEPCKR